MLELVHKVLQCFGAFNKSELNLKDCNEMGNICSWVVQFCKIGTSKESVKLSK